MTTRRRRSSLLPLNHTVGSPKGTCSQHRKIPPWAQQLLTGLRAAVMMIRIRAGSAALTSFCRVLPNGQRVDQMSDLTIESAVPDEIEAFQLVSVLEILCFAGALRLFHKAVFSSHDLPSGLSDKARFALWQDMHVAKIGSVEFKASDMLPFAAEIEATAIGALVIGQMAGTIKQSDRQARNVAEDGHDGYLLFVNKGNAMLAGAQLGRDCSIGPGEAVLVSAAEPLRMMGGDRNLWANVVIPRDVLAAAFKHIDDKLAFRVGAENEALGLLRRYCRMIEAGPPLMAPGLIAHASEAIVDLVGLATGAKGEAAEIAGLRGLRAARSQAILAKIGDGFTDPEISARTVAVSLGLSVRYVHELLEETGFSFAEHVLELRLQKTRQILTDRANDSLLVSEVAYACGFSSLSYFNRAFRRRFGCTPGSTR